MSSATPLQEIHAAVMLHSRSNTYSIYYYLHKDVKYSFCRMKLFLSTKPLELLRVICGQSETVISN